MFDFQQAQKESTGPGIYSAASRNGRYSMNFLTAGVRWEGGDGEADRAVVGVCQRADLDAVGDAPQDQIRQDPDAEPAFRHSHDRKILPRRKPDVWLHVRALQQVGDLGLLSVL